MGSSGLHSNGYSLARKVLLADWSLERDVPEFGRTLGEEMLEPTLIYTKDCLALAGADLVHAFSHVTGGGLASNLARVLPSHLHADIERSSWALPPVFGVLMDRGVARDDAERTFNMGIGMIAVVPDPTPAVALLTSRGIPAWVCGAVRQRTGEDVSDAPAKGGHGGTVTLRG
jgi:phosphoribosylformylglycinamidine cyclo-ligase